MAVVIEHGYPVKPLMQQVQKSVRNEIEYITGMSIERMSIKVKNIIETKRKIVKAIGVRMKSYYIYTYGCQMNTADSERLSHQLESVGYIPTEDAETADLIC